MSTIEKIAAGMFALIAVYLIIASRGDFNTVIKAISAQVSSIVEALQGRDSNVGGVRSASVDIPPVQRG